MMRTLLLDGLCSAGLSARHIAAQCVRPCRPERAALHPTRRCRYAAL